MPMILYMKRPLGLRLLALFFAIMTASSATAEDVGNCNKASEQLKQAQSYSPSDLRLKRMTATLLPEIETVLKELDRKGSPYPRKFLQTCLEAKVNAFDTHVSNAGGDMVGRPAFNAAVGERLMLQKNYSAAYVYFSRAALVDLINPSFHRRRYDAWILWQASNLEGLDRDKYYNTLIFHLNPLLELRNVPIKDKEEAHVQIGQAALMFKKFEEVVPHFETALTYNSQRGDAVINLSHFYLLRGDEAKALDVLTKFAPKQKNDNPYTVEMYERMAALLRRAQKFDLAQSYMKQAQNRFPSNPRIRELTARALAENKQFQNAENLVRNERISSLNARRTKALILENKGDAAFNKRLYGQANSFYTEALALFPNNNELRLKMAQVLFDAHFAGKSTAAMRQLDMDSAVGYLNPVYKSSSTSSIMLGLYIQVAARSSKPELAREACAKYTKAFGDINSLMVAQDCLKVKGSLFAKTPAPAKRAPASTRSPAAAKTPKSKAAPATKRRL
jgi:tetratricopeptide (TPR) repeat protein